MRMGSRWTQTPTRVLVIMTMMMMMMSAVMMSPTVRNARVRGAGVVMVAEAAGVDRAEVIEGTAASVATAVDGFRKKNQQTEEDVALVFGDDVDELKAAVCEACHASHDALARSVDPTDFASACSLVAANAAAVSYYFEASGEKMRVGCDHFVRDAENIIAVVAKFTAAMSTNQPASVSEVRQYTLGVMTRHASG